MTVAFAGKVQFCPILGFCVFEKPRDCLAVDFRHIFQCCIVFLLSNSSRSRPEQFRQVGMLEFLLEILFKMTHAVTVGADRKDFSNAVNETFLSIRKNGKFLLSVKKIEGIH